MTQPQQLNSNKVLHIISHTHWDREWYLPFELFRMKLVEMIDNLLDLLAQDPDFKHFHLDAQTIVLEDYAQVRPGRIEELRAHIRSGRVLVGPWYEQNDEFLTTGESTVRNLLTGMDLARRSGGCMRLGYIPDQFGHVSQMPQILRQFGLDTAILGRGRNIHPGDSAEFRWQAPDGSEVLGSFMVHWYNNAQRFPEDPEAAAYFLDTIVERLSQHARSRHLLLMNGVDHLEAQENLSPILKQLQRDRPQYDIRHSILPDYVQALRKEMADAKLPLLKGELRQGNENFILANTASTHVDVKRANIASSIRLERAVEPFITLERLVGYTSIPSDYLIYCWKLLMQNHPHDSICACSHDGVIADMKNRFQRLNQNLDGLQDRCLSRYGKLVNKGGLQGADQLLLIFNPNSQPLSAVVHAGIDFLASKNVGQFSLESPEGKAISYEIIHRDKRGPSAFNGINLPGKNNVDHYEIEFSAEKVPPFGYAAYVVRAGHRPQQPAAAKAPKKPVLENEYLRAVIHKNGSMTLTDKGTGQIYKNCFILEDGGDRGDSYIYHRPKQDTVITTIESEPAIDLLRHDALATVYAIRHVLSLPEDLADAEGHRRSRKKVRCPITLTLTLRAGAHEIEVEAQMENHAIWHRLRVLVPTGYASGIAHTGSAFDIVARPSRRPAECAIYDNHTEPNLYFADVHDGKTGLAVFNEGLHEYELLDDRAGTLALTLLRSTGIITGTGKAEAQEFPEVDWLIPGAQCLGTRTVRFAIHPHAGDVHAADIYNQALRWLTPIPSHTVPVDEKDWSCGRPFFEESRFRSTFSRFEPGDDLPQQLRRLSLLSIEGKGIVASAIKPALEGDAIIVRVFNPLPRKTRCTIKFPRPVQRVEEANLDENPVAIRAEKTQQFSQEIGPKKIVTWRITI